MEILGAKEPTTNVLWKPIEVNVSPEQIQALKASNHKLIEHLEQGEPLMPAMLGDLKAELSAIVNGTPAFAEALDEMANSRKHMTIQLLHEDNEILNLPWTLAVDQESQKQLGDFKRLVLTKGLRGADTTLTFSKIAPPLKILIMISSPQDTDHRNRLSYEDEERAIFSAFEPLLQAGQVSIDFTDDGSLEALQRKLRQNNYHILHFSGHSTFKGGMGYLQLENSLTFRTELVSAQDFKEALSCNPDYCPPLVLLSSCQSAQGGSEMGLRGITDELLKMHVPGVICMGMSIRDRYASHFAARFYEQIANKQNILTAFKTATDSLFSFEYERMAEMNVQKPNPLQWLIPNLYLSSKIEHLVDWQAPQKDLRVPSFRLFSKQNRQILTHDDRYVFVGRRKDKAAILEPFFNKDPILLRGQGGVGKTAMAEYLIQRLQVAEPDTQPILINENIKSIQDINTLLKEKLAELGHIDAAGKAERYDKAIEQFQYFVFELEKICTPVFAFDNLETFQSDPGAAFALEHMDLAKAIGFLCSIRRFHLILTGRYPLPDFPDAESFDLNQVGLTDFWKKCHYLPLFTIYQKHAHQDVDEQKLSKRKSIKFIDLVTLLHETFGGNYRALEFFSAICREDPRKLNDNLKSLEEFRDKTKTETAEVLQRMRGNLILSQLLNLLDDEEQALLRLCAHFRIPVQDFAFVLQVRISDGTSSVLKRLPQILTRLSNLTLIEASIDRETGKAYYYVTPIVRDMLEQVEPSDRQLSFSSKQAGIYHLHMFENMERNLTEWEEAFFQLFQAGEKEYVQSIGEAISRFYYNYYEFQSAFYYARQVHALVGDETHADVLNLLGLLLDRFGSFEDALVCYQAALAKYREESNKAGEGAALNNISQVYHTQGDFETAVEYLEKSLRITREVGDKHGEASNLNNIGRIRRAEGDFGTALKFLKESLEISREIGEREGESMTLNNLSQVHHDQGDLETALKYLRESLEISRELGDKTGEGLVISNIGGIYFSKGDYESSLAYYEKSLGIRREIGDKKGEGANLSNIASLYHTRQDHEAALAYFEKSVEIRQEIGDKRGEGMDLHNMAMVEVAKEDSDIRKVIEYEHSAWELAMETGNTELQYTVGHLFGHILCAMGQKDDGIAVIKQCIQIGMQSNLPDVAEYEEILKTMETNS